MLSCCGGKNKQVVVEEKWLLEMETEVGYLAKAEIFSLFEKKTPNLEPELHPSCSGNDRWTCCFQNVSDILYNAVINVLTVMQVSAARASV